jgi:hypothetical protein
LEEMKLVSNWKDAWKWFSMWCMGAAAAMQSAWVTIPQEWRDTIPNDYVMYATIIALMLGAVGRVVDQGLDGA